MDKEFFCSSPVKSIRFLYTSALKGMNYWTRTEEGEMAVRQPRFIVSADECEKTDTDEKL